MRTGDDGPRCAPDQHPLTWRASVTPDAPAIEAAQGTWAFSTLDDRARRGAGHLLGEAVVADRPVALLMEAGPDFVAWFHAIAYAGRPALPLNTRLTVAEIARQLADARVERVIGATSDPRLATLREALPWLHCDPAPPLESLPRPGGELPGDRADPGTRLAVLYTSGTSGRARGACLTRGNFTASARAALERLGPATRGRWLACMPLFHVGGLSILWRSVEFGGAVRLAQRFDVDAVALELGRGDIDGVSLVPTMLSRLLEAYPDRRASPRLAAVLLGGAAAPDTLVERAIALGYPVCPTYGLTEACSQVATAAPPVPGATCASPMRPIAGTQLRIVTDLGEEAAPGVPGGIEVRGPTVMQGYLHDAEATARVLRDGWLSTGDVGEIGDDGGLRVLDRRDDLIVTGGENVYPAEVEAVLLAHPEVVDAGVAGLPDADLGARVVAWLVARPGAAVDEDALRRHCRIHLAGFKQPREFRFVASVPRNAAGKLERWRLVAAR